MTSNATAKGLVLGIETSCDETAAAVVADGEQVLSSVVSSQARLHARFGGVVPEVAGRAHLERITPVIDEAIRQSSVNPRDISTVAATSGPGLVGALLVGVSAGKALSLVWDVPFVAVNHLEAHLHAVFLDKPDVEMPVIVVLVSGGHTMLVLMQSRLRYQVLGATVDDAAGEAFDKVARHLGLGYPGGPAIDNLSSQGSPNAIAFPRPMLNDGWNFSFSGLKTAVFTYLRRNPAITNTESPTSDASNSGAPPSVTARASSSSSGTASASSSNPGVPPSGISRIGSSSSGAPPSGTASADPSGDISSASGVSVADVAASFQEAVADVLTTKALRSAAVHQAKGVCLAGGVAANSRLRELTVERCGREGLAAYLPSRAMCTDNAAMVAAAGWWRLQADGPSPLTAGANPSLGLPNRL